MTWENRTPYVERLSERVYAYLQPTGGWMVNNCGFVVDHRGDAVLIDTTSTEQRNRAFLAAVADQGGVGTKAVVNTHFHPDHTYGNCFVPDAAVIVGQDRCREEVIAAGLEATRVITSPNYGDVRLRPPELTFSERLTLHLEEFPVELRAMGCAHTNNDVIVWLPQQRVLFAGDLAVCGGQPFMLEGSVAGFAAAIAAMRELAPEVLVPGHGPVCRGDAVPRLFDDLDAYVDYVRAVAGVSYVDGLTPLEAAQKYRDNPYRDWAESERLVANLHRAFSELAGNPLDARITVPSVWADVVAFHGGPIECHA